MTFTRPCLKPVRNDTDYQEKSISVAGKIACLDGKCAKCGKLGQIYGHHIIHRKYRNTCALVENLLPVCVFCHSEIHANELAFKAWLALKRPGLYDRLWEIAREICNLDWAEVYEKLLLEYKAKLEEKVKRDGL